MDTTTKFSLNRLFHLMGRHLFMNLKYYLTLFASLGGIVIIISLLSSLVNNGYYDVQNLLVQSKVFAFLGGIIITSSIFKELDTKSRGWFYMMLPANPLEKLLACWLISSLGFAVMVSAVMVITSIISSLLSLLFFNSMFYVINPFNVQFGKYLIHYCIVQSIFFLGAIYFEKHHFLKTILSIILLSMGLMFIVGIAAKFMFNDWSVQIQPEQSNDFTEPFIYIIKVLYYVLLVPFSLTVSYFRLKEKEV